MIRFASYVFSFLFLIAAGGTAKADEVSEARDHYNRGTTLYDLGKYIDAAHEYEAAFNLKSDSALLFNIGQAYRFGGDNASAIRAYRSYLRRLPEAQNRAEVERTLETLRTAPAHATPVASPSAVAKSQIADSPPPTSQVTGSSTVGSLRRRPVYKRWWPWTVAGVVVVGVAVGVSLALTIPKNANAAGAVPVTFP